MTRRARYRLIAAFRRDHPEWDGIPDEAVEKSATFAWWDFGQALDELGRAFLDAIRDLPLIGRLFR